MAKLSFASFILFLLFIAFTGNILVRVSGKDCSEDLGECDADCTPRCKAAHPNALGSCVGPFICRCLFQCNTCTENLGRLGTCVLDQCKAACANKRPNRNAVGYCFTVGEAGSNCVCDYDCW